jgi:succinate dehydrogenase / fumarate reductase flavoprotein subunit
MQGLADGYFVIPYTIAQYLVQTKPGKAKVDHAECNKSIEDVKGYVKKLLSINGKETPADFMRKLGNVMWNNVGMGRSKESLTEAIQKIPGIREEFWKNLKVAGTGVEINQQLENAGRTADFIEFAELLCRDALNRDESCGAHFRVEHQFADGEAKRDDGNFMYVAAWGFKGDGAEPELHKEPLEFNLIKPAVRSYK